MAWVLPFVPFLPYVPLFLAERILLLTVGRNRTILSIVLNLVLFRELNGRDVS